MTNRTVDLSFIHRDEAAIFSEEYLEYHQVPPRHGKSQISTILPEHACWSKINKSSFSCHQSGVIFHTDRADCECLAHALLEFVIFPAPRLMTLYTTTSFRVAVGLTTNGSRMRPSRACLPTRDTHGYTSQLLVTVSY